MSGNSLTASEKRVLKAALAWFETRPFKVGEEAKAKANTELFDACRAYKPVAPSDREYGDPPNQLGETNLKHFGKHLEGGA